MQEIWQIFSSNKFSWNPAHELHESDRHPSARFFRTDFFQKIKDTFYFFAGSLFRKKNHLGIIDYPLLTISFRFNALFIWCLDNLLDRLLAKILLLPVFLISTPLMVLRYILATVLTIVVSPIVAVVHGFSKIEGNSLRSKFDQLLLTVTRKDSEGMETILAEKISLNDYAADTEKLRCEEVSGTYNALIISLSKRDPQLHVTDRVQIQLNLTQSKDKKIFDSIEKLNLGHSILPIEKLGIYQEIERNLKII